MTSSDDIIDQLRAATCLSDIGHATIHAGRELLGASAVAFLQGPPFGAYGTEPLLFHESIPRDELVAGGQRSLAKLIEEFVVPGRAVIPNGTVDLLSTFGTSYLEKSEVYNEYWRPCHVERQLVACIGEGASPFAIVSIARSASERAFKDQELETAEWLRGRVAAACARIHRVSTEKALLGTIAAGLPQPWALFDALGFLVWATAAAEREWSTHGRSLARWRTAALACSAATASRLIVEGFDVHQCAAVARDGLPTFLVTQAPTPFDFEWGLTRREGEVLKHLALGRANKDIAAELACSPRTVEVHVASILRKSGMKARTELMAKLVRPFVYEPKLPG